MTLDQLIGQGLNLAHTGRRDRDSLDNYQERIKGLEKVVVTFHDVEDDVTYSKSLADIPWMGNVSAGDKILSVEE